MASIFTDKISADQLVHCFSYLWFQDAFALAAASSKCRDIIINNKELARIFLEALFKRTGREAGSFLATSPHSAGELYSMASRITPWPTAPDLCAARKHPEKPQGLRVIKLPGVPEELQPPLIAYQGQKLGNNRAIVANDHFPVLKFPDYSKYSLGKQKFVSELDKTIKRSSVPFTRLVYQKQTSGGGSGGGGGGNGQLLQTKSSKKKSGVFEQQSRKTTVECSVSLSRVAYYEAYMHPPIQPTDAKPPRANLKPCIAVGLSRPTFDTSSMPGWDSNSFGYHGDDGLFFYEQPTLGRKLSTILNIAESPGLFQQNVSQAQGGSQQDVAQAWGGGAGSGQAQGSGKKAGGSNNVKEESAHHPSPIFGVGDTIGCGLVYPQGNDTCGAIFFTKNGVLMHVRLVRDNPYLFSYAWFPTVGTDCYSPIEMRFGGGIGPGATGTTAGQAFVFDVLRFERERQWLDPRLTGLLPYRVVQPRAVTAVGRHDSSSSSGGGTKQGKKGKPAVARVDLKLDVLIKRFRRLQQRRRADDDNDGAAGGGAGGAGGGTAVATETATAHQENGLADNRNGKLTAGASAGSAGAGSAGAGSGSGNGQGSDHQKKNNGGGDKKPKWNKGLVGDPALQHPLIRNPWDFRRHHYIDERILHVIIGRDPNLGIPRPVLERPIYQSTTTDVVAAAGGGSSSGVVCDFPSVDDRAYRKKLKKSKKEDSSGATALKESNLYYLHEQDRSLFLDDCLRNATIADFRRHRYIRRKIVETGDEDPYFEAQFLDAVEDQIFDISGGGRGVFEDIPIAGDDGEEFWDEGDDEDDNEDDEEEEDDDDESEDDDDEDGGDDDEAEVYDHEDDDKSGSVTKTAASESADGNDDNDAGGGDSGNEDGNEDAAGAAAGGEAPAVNGKGGGGGNSVDIAGETGTMENSTGADEGKELNEEVKEEEEEEEEEDEYLYSDGSPSFTLLEFEDAINSLLLRDKNICIGFTAGRYRHWLGIARGAPIKVLGFGYGVENQTFPTPDENQDNGEDDDDEEEEQVAVGEEEGEGEEEGKQEESNDDITAVAGAATTAAVAATTAAVAATAAGAAIVGAAAAGGGGGAAIVGGGGAAIVGAATTAAVAGAATTAAVAAAAAIVGGGGAAAIVGGGGAAAAGGGNSNPPNREYSNRPVQSVSYFFDPDEGGMFFHSDLKDEEREERARLQRAAIHFARMLSGRILHLFEESRRLQTASSASTTTAASTGAAATGAAATGATADNAGEATGTPNSSGGV